MPKVIWSEAMVRFPAGQLVAGILDEQEGRHFVGAVQAGKFQIRHEAYRINLHPAYSEEGLRVFNIRSHGIPASTSADPPSSP